jgi:general secretion pathway protein A
MKSFWCWTSPLWSTLLVWTRARGGAREAERLPVFCEFFGFREKPFGKTPNPAYLYETPQHREALARLEYAVEEKELAVLTGAVGCGKTTLSRALLDRLGETRPVILLINPRITPAQLLREIAGRLGLPPRRSRKDVVDALHTTLYELHERQREPVVVIDEAQLIPAKATFDEIRLLTNFQLDDQNLLSVVLIGQPELDQRLLHPRYSALAQRIGIRYTLGPLDEEDTRAYVSHRIRVAGGSRNPFTDDAVDALHALSGGVPRVINSVATTALLDAYGDDSEVIDRERVMAAGREHRLTGEH